MGDFTWRDSRAWLVLCSLVVVASAGVLVLVLRVHLPPVPCTVPTAAQTLALRHSSSHVDRLADWVDVLCAVAMGIAGGGLLVSRGPGRWWLMLCLLVAAGIGLGAAGYASNVPQRGCGI